MNSPKVNAHAVVDKNGQYVVEFTSGLLRKIEQVWREYDGLDTSLMSDIIMALLGHELAHIAYDDVNRAKWKPRLVAILTVMTLGALAYSALYQWVPVSITVMCLLIYILYMHFFADIFLDIRYWGQMCELRADRIGVHLSGIEFELMEAVLNSMDYDLPKEKNKVHSYYRRYLLIDLHPSVRRRIEFLREGKSWSMFDYLRQAWFIRLDLYKRKGWYGN